MVREDLARQRIKIDDKWASAQEIISVLAERNWTIKELSLYYMWCGPLKACGIVEVLLHPQSRLSVLNISYNAIGDKGCIALANCLPHTQLSFLNLRDNQIGNAGVLALCKSVVTCKFLLGLDLAFNLFDDEGLLGLSKALPQCALTQLFLAGSGYRVETGCDAESALLQSVSFSNLKTLTFWIHFSSALLSLGKNSKLESLELNCCSMFPSSVWEAFLSQTNPCLRRLSFQSSTMPSRILGFAKVFETCPNLEVLCLNGCALDIASAMEIIQVLPTSNVVALDLNVDQLNNETLRAISKALPLSKISTFTLSTFQNRVDLQRQNWEELISCLRRGPLRNLTLECNDRPEWIPRALEYTKRCMRLVRQVLCLIRVLPVDLIRLVAEMIFNPAEQEKEDEILRALVNSW